MRRINPRHKILLTLVFISTSPVVIAATTGLINLNDNVQLSARESTCEAIADKCIKSFERMGVSGLQSNASRLISEDPTIRRFTLTRFDGLKLCDVVAPENVSTEETILSHWIDMPKVANDILKMPVRRNGKLWVTIDAEFAAISWFQTASGKLLSIIGLVMGVNLITFGLFLKRTLSFMDPKNAVPKRVRNTLDTISSGIVLLDAEARILVINDAFAAHSQKTREECIGSTLDQFKWNVPDDGVLPWHRAFETKTPYMSTIELSGRNEQLQIFNTNATPVFDASDALAGVLVSFEDVTQIEAQRKDLLKAFRELEYNKEQIRRQNEALKELASRDALTGAHNRRALYEFLDDCWCKKDEMPNGMIGMMMDIDHFKKLNDVHGHAVGDAVLKDFVKVCKAALGNAGFLGRYGGEEFCVILPDSTLEEGLQVAERIRIAIETKLAIPYAVTTSIGVSSSLLGAATGQALIEEADKGLYAAKHSGRNQSHAYSADVEQLALELNSKNKLAKLELQREDLPISYQAAVSLHTALMYKHPATALHSQRVAELAISLARGLLGVRDLYVLEIAALLHDIGQISVPDRLLQADMSCNVAALTIEHKLTFCENGVSIVQAAFHSQALTNVLRYHLCRFDGVGSPPGTPVGLDLPIAARIVGLVNAYDELTTGAHGLPPLSPEEAFLRLQLSSGTRFDPDLVERFCNMQVGWRIDSSFLTLEQDNRQIVDLGHHLERAMYAFDTGDINTLNRRLEMIESVAEAIEMPHIGRIAGQLRRNLDRKTARDLEGMVPMLQDLIESCGTILRAYLRSVASHSEAVTNSINHDVASATPVILSDVLADRNISSIQSTFSV